MISVILCALLATSVIAASPLSIPSTLPNVTLHDDIGQRMESVRVGPGNPPSTFIALYHTRDAQTATYNIHVATSADPTLRTWAWKALLVHNADMPYMTTSATSLRILVAHEQWMGPNSTSPCRIRVSTYNSFDDIVAGAAPVRTTLLPDAHSHLQGTPNIFSWDEDGDIAVMGFHYNDNVTRRDQVASGVMSGLSSGGPIEWHAWEEKAYNTAMTASGATGNVGDRDTFRVVSVGAFIVQEGNTGMPPP